MVASMVFVLAQEAGRSIEAHHGPRLLEGPKKYTMGLGSGRENLSPNSERRRTGTTSKESETDGPDAELEGLVPSIHFR
jgi:hypothetical protein